MTTSKLAILESGYASIRQIERPAERRLALQDLQKQMQEKWKVDVSAKDLAHLSAQLMDKENENETTRMEK